MRNTGNRWSTSEKVQTHPGNPSTPVDRQSGREHMAAVAALVLGLVVYLAFAVGNAAVRTPYPDEGFFASPSYNLATKGQMGTTVIDSAGTALLRLREHTYWVMPLYVVIEAGWFKLVGCGLFRSRLLSVISGLGVLLAMFEIVWKLSGDLVPAGLTVFLLGIDFTFVDVGSLARMDMMTAAFGFGGLASYLILRQRNFAWAVFVSQTLAACSGMTNPNGVLYFVALLFITFYMDGRTIRLRHLLLGAVPYLIAAGAWGAYILRDLGAFRSQFAFNASQGSRLQWLIHPFAGFATELSNVYSRSFILTSETLHPKAIVLTLYLLGIVSLLAVRSLRSQRSSRILLSLWFIFFVIQSIFNLKIWFYLVHILPLYAAILAVALWALWRHRLAPRPVLAGVLLILCVIEVGGGAYRFKTKIRRRKRYDDFITFVNRHAGPTALIIGNSRLGFDLGFDGRLVDTGLELQTATLGHKDFRIGCAGNRAADLILLDEPYGENLTYVARHRPSLYAEIRQELQAHFQLIYDHDGYKVYGARKGARETACGKSG